MSLSLGIDIGSTTIKLVALDNGCLVQREVVPATSFPLQNALKLLSGFYSAIPIVATGYGRDLLDSYRTTPTISEIKAHALGARYLFPECQSVVDIGGQDVKIISLDPKGKIKRFEMNDRCAAGTGKFLEIMANRLQYSLEGFSDAALKGKNKLEINAICTVFAESEIVSLLNRGENPEDISRALHYSVIKKIHSIFMRVEANGPVAFTGGGSLNKALRVFTEEKLNVNLLYNELGQFAGALGCACEASKLSG